jgi:hypothetical protein
MTAFLRSDALPGDAAIGYVADGRTNVHHLPVVGSGDGGAYTTVADVHRLWWAAETGVVVAPATWATMTAARSTAADGRRYGAGVWLDAEGPGRVLEGCDAGVSFMTRRDADADVTWTVVSNTTAGAWPIARALTV